MSIRGNRDFARKPAGTRRASAPVARGLALIFALVLLFAAFPQAFAAEAVDEEAPAGKTTTANPKTVEEKLAESAATFDAKSAKARKAEKEKAEAELAKIAATTLRDIDYRLAFRFRFSGDSPVPELNRGDWPWVYNRCGNGVIERPKIADGTATFTDGGAMTGGTGTVVAVEFNCAAFLCAFEIAEVKNAVPAIVVGFGHALTGKISGGNGFFVKTTRNSIQLEDQKTGEIVVEAKDLALGGESFKKIVVVNSPRGSAIFADGKAVAYSPKFISGRSRQPFGIGGSAGLPGLRYAATHSRLNAKLRSVSVFEGHAPRASSLGLALKKLLFRFDFAGNTASPVEDNVDWTWGAFFDLPKLVGDAVEFDGNPLHTGDFEIVRNVSGFDTGAFACAFEIAEVRNRVPAVVACCGHGMYGKIRSQIGFFLKATCESLILEDQRTHKIVLEAHGLPLESETFKKVFIASSPRGSVLLIDGFVVARSDKAIFAGNAAQPFGIGGAPGLPNTKNPDEYRRLQAKLKNFAVYSIEEVPIKTQTKAQTKAQPETQPETAVPAETQTAVPAEEETKSDAESAGTTPATTAFGTPADAGDS